MGEAELFEYFPADAAAWISETPLRAEYARLMRGFHRPIPWEQSHATSYTPGPSTEGPTETERGEVTHAIKLALTTSLDCAGCPQ